MTTPLHLPFHRWPLRGQCLLALAAVVVCGLGAQAWLRVSNAGLQASQSTLQRTKATLAQTRRLPLATPESPDARSQALLAGNVFTTLPPRARADDVVRDAGREAQALGLAIGTLGVSQQAATPREWGRVTFTVAASGDYRAAKAWVAALLARYPSLAVQSFGLRATGIGGADAARQELQATLVWWVRD
jgi:hypothetical protein